ncbi:MAG: ABC transporter permease [Aquificaceae bacterium]
MYIFDIAYVLTQKEIKVRYKSSVLGYAWSILHPLTFAFVFYLAFKVFMKVPIEDYPLFLISGLFPWQWFSNAVSSSVLVLLDNASLIKKLNFPRETIPLSSVMNHTFHFLLSIPVVILFMYIYGKELSGLMPILIPFLLLVQFLMTYGLALFLSSIHLFFRDTDRLVGIILTLLFYFTPVVYSENMIPESYRALLYLNPLALLMVNWRNLFLKGFIDLSYFLSSLAYSILIFFIGYVTFRRLSWRFAEVL